MVGTNLYLFKKPATKEEKTLYAYVANRAVKEANRLANFIRSLTPDKGILVVISGAQNSGKSLLLTELMGLLVRDKNRKIACFYPDVDRPDIPKGFIYSRHGEKFQARGYKTKNDIERLFHDFDVVLVDETQFTPYELQSYLIKEAEAFVSRGGVFVAAALPYTSLQGEFLISTVLRGKADEVVRLKATCQMCGRTGAIRNQRIVDGKASDPHDEDLVPPSAEVHYEPRCDECIVR